ncbi:MAG: prohibitin family protein [Syntrophomonas sp.]|nr:prohibitin family protein [Syntrophomonas sp.]
MLLLRPLVSVPVGYVGIILQQGKIQETLMDAGLHLRIPGYQKIVYLDCRVQSLEMQALASSRDLETLNAAVSLYYHIDPSRAGKLYQKEGISYEDSLIAPIIEESLQSVFACYSSRELLSQYPQVVAQSSRIITRKLAESNIIVDRFNIPSLVFSSPATLSKYIDRDYSQKFTNTIWDA